MNETQLQTQVLKYLKAKNIFHWRNNNHATRGRQHNTLHGVPDIICLLGSGITLLLELKAPDRGKLSPAQIEFAQRVTTLGHAYYVIRSLEDVMKIV